MSHAPKHAMLIALQGKRLSQAGQRRAQRHLEVCEVCRNAATGHHALSDLLVSARGLALPAASADISLALRREARAQSVASSRRTLFQALSVAAALGLAVFVGSRLAWTPQAAPRVEPSATATPAVRADDDSATTARRSAAPTPDTTAPSIMPGSANTLMAEGAVLRAATEALRIALWQGTELVLAPDSEARVVTFRDHQLHLLLLRGSVANEVAPLGADERYVIEVNGHLVTVRGTRFVVTKTSDGKAEVTLSEGKVDLTRGDALISRMVAPAHWVEDKPFDPRSAATKASAIDEGSGAPNPLRLGKRTPTDRADAGQVAPKAVQHLLARAAPLLRSCHEASKRTHPELPTQVQLALQVAATGQVEAVEVTAAGTVLPDDLVACLRARALTWHLALQVAGPVQVLIPLQFGAAR